MILDMIEHRRVMAARQHLVLNFPFFATLTGRLQYEQAHCGTADVDGVTLRTDPRFTQSLSFDELVGVVAHEGGHCGLGHHARRGGRDPEIWNIACLAAGTPVLMADGSSRPIETIRVGDLVWSPSGPSRVLEVLDRGIKPVLEISHSGTSLFATPDHRFLTTNGFVDAALLNTGLHCEVLRTPRRAGICARQLQTRIDRGPLPLDRSVIYERSASSPASRADGRSLHPQGLTDSNSREAFGERAGLSSWDYRWGRDDHDCCKEEHLLSTGRDDQQHLDSASGLAFPARLRHRFSDQQQRSPLLAANVVGLSARQISVAGSSVPCDQGPALRSGLGVHLDTASAIEASATNGTYARDCLDTALAERTTVVVGGTRETRHVFDLVTEHHVFAAAGLLTHNCDLALNPLLFQAGLVLPKGALFDASMVDEKGRPLPAEVIYTRLKQPNLVPQSQGLGQDDASSGGQAGDDEEVAEDLAKLDDDSEEAGEEGSEPGDDEDQGESQEASEEEADEGESESEGQGGAEESEEEPVGNYGGCGSFRDPPVEMGQDPQLAQAEQAQAWEVAAMQAVAAAKGAGDLPGYGKWLIEEARAPKVDWRDVLREFVQVRVRSDATWNRPNRRYIHQGTYLPSRDTRAMGEMVVVTDVSGSCWGPMQEAFAAELNAVIEDVRPRLTHLVYWDTHCQGHEEFEPDDLPLNLEARGGGGTVYTGIWKWIEDHDIDPTCVVVLTDLEVFGFGAEPDYPVLWCSTLRTTAPWGEVVELTL